jgi:orotidine-5'-phosphate decarboxylase
VLAVTVLTSLDDADTLKIFGRSSKDQIRQFVIDALEAGVDGIICSPKDLSHIKNRKGTSSLFKVTTGLRPEWASKDDQKRTATPREAIYGGADLLVIGRPITCPSRKIGSTIKAAELIHNEVADALRERV